MFIKSVTIIIISIIIQSGCSTKQLFTLCNLSDPKLNDCIKNDAQSILSWVINGLPQIGLPSLDPFDVEDTPISGRNPDVNFMLRDIKFYGMNTSKIDAIELQPNKKRILMNLTNSGTLKGSFAMQGDTEDKISGRVEIHMSNFSYQYIIHYTAKASEGSKIWTVSKHRVSYLPGKMEYKLPVSVNGNQGFTEWLLSFMNSNWRECLVKYMGPLMEKITEAPVNHINKLFSLYPEEQLILV